MLADRSNSIIPGYEIVEMSWEIQAFPDGPNITVKGTIEDAVAEVTELNPNWKTDFDFDNRVAAASTDNIPWDEWDRVICRNFPEDFYLKKNNALSRGVIYLQHTKGVPKEQPGPRRCGRVSCSYNAAIYWCNDVFSIFLNRLFNSCLPYLASRGHRTRKLCLDCRGSAEGT